MIQIKKTILTLVALFAVTAGAWAQDAFGVKEIVPPADWEIDGTNATKGDFPGFVGITIDQAKAWTGAPSSGLAVLFYNFDGEDISYAYFLNGTFNSSGSNIVQRMNMYDAFANGVKQYYTASAASTVDIAWDGAKKTGTFKMPGGNVTLEPEYYPQAALTAAPTAINDVPATTDGAIVKAGTVANIGSTETAQGTVMYYVSPTALDDAALLALAADQWTADVPTAEKLAQGEAYVYYYVRGNDSDTDETTFSDGDILSANALTVTIAAAPTYAVTFKAANANTIEAGKATVTVGGKAATVTDGKLQGVKMGSEVKMTAKQGYKFRKVEAKKGGGEPVLLTTITAADNSSFKSGSQTFGDVATVTLTGDYLTNDGSHGGWYCLGTNKTATISVAAANGANITSVKFYTAGGGIAEDKDAPFEVTTTSVTSSNITTYLNGNSIGSYGVSKIEVYGTK